MSDPLDKIQYKFITPDLPEDAMNEALGILDTLNSRKVDKVNWEERAQMNEISKRSGKYLVTEDVAKEQLVDKSKENIEQEEVKEDKEVRGPTKKEDDLLGYLGGIMNLLEGFDDKK